jgi:hypothetical protein
MLREYIKTLTKAGGCFETQLSPAYLQRLHSIRIIGFTSSTVQTFHPDYFERTLHATIFSILTILASYSAQQFGYHIRPLDPFKHTT